LFERFTDRARRVVVLAQEESRMLNHNYIGTEHLLLGLIHEGKGIAAKALASLDVSLEAVRSQVEEIVGRGNAAPSGHIPFTPRAKKVLELSLRESRRLGHSYIGTEHILLGLIREGEGVGAQVLVKHGADLDRARQAVLRLLGESEDLPPEHERTIAGPMPSLSSIEAPSAMALFDEGAVGAIHLAQELAKRRRRTVLSAEHLLFGLIGSEHPQVSFILRMLGASDERMQKMVHDLLGDRPTQQEPGQDAGPDEAGDTNP
jgi:ATP-dependent Clp protease ATP-binding subunit ClpA